MRRRLLCLEQSGLRKNPFTVDGDAFENDVALIVKHSLESHPVSDEVGTVYPVKPQVSPKSVYRRSTCLRRKSLDVGTARERGTNVIDGAEEFLTVSEADAPDESGSFFFALDLVDFFFLGIRCLSLSKAPSTLPTPPSLIMVGAYVLCGSTSPPSLIACPLIQRAPCEDTALVSTLLLIVSKLLQQRTDPTRP